MLREERYIEVYDKTTGRMIDSIYLPPVPLSSLQELWHDEIQAAKKEQNVPDSEWDWNMWDGRYSIQTIKQITYFEQLLGIRFDIEKNSYFFVTDLWPMNQ